MRYLSIIFLGLFIQTAAVAQPGSHEFQGKVVAAQEAEIAAQADGRLTKIHFTAGQIVEKGDLLFDFDVKLRQNAVAAARARQKVIEAQLQLSEVKLKNVEKLRARNVSSEIELIEAKAQYDVAAATLDEAKADVGATQIFLDHMQLFAPIDGMIGSPLIREGAYLTLEAFQPNRLAVIVNLNPIHVVAEIPFDAYTRQPELFTGQPAPSQKRDYTLIRPDGKEYPYKGRVVAGASEFDPASQTLAITLEFENPELLLRPGLAVTLRSSAR